MPQLAAEQPGVRVAIVHRVGKLAVGEVAVVIAASAPHRAAAFDACRAAIDRLKESVPIWKKEIAEDGESGSASVPENRAVARAIALTKAISPETISGAN